MDSSSPNRVIHGVLVNVLGVGVLIMGESGTGKSECALELVSGGHKLIADDVIEVEPVGDRLFGRPPKGFTGLLAVRDLGIIDVRKHSGDASVEPRHSIDLCIALQDPEDSQPKNTSSEFEMYGLRVPKLTVSVTRHRNLSLFVETAVRHRGSASAGVDI